MPAAPPSVVHAKWVAAPSQRFERTHRSVTTCRSPLRPRRHDSPGWRPTGRTREVDKDPVRRRRLDRRYPKPHRLLTVRTEPPIDAEHTHQQRRPRPAPAPMTGATLRRHQCLRPRRGRLRPGNHPRTQRRVGRQHTVVDHRVLLRWRDHRRKPGHELRRTEHHRRRPIAPGPLHLQHHLTIIPPLETRLRQRRTADVPCQSLKTRAVSRPHGHSSVEVVSV